MEEMHMVRYRGKGIELPRPLPEYRCVRQPGSSPKLILLGFVEASLHGHD